MVNTRLEPNALILLPFATLLLSLALAPLILSRHWERHYHKLCLGLAAVTASYYIFALHAGGRVVHAAGEYTSFMVVVGSFFVVAGGIHIRLRGHGTPISNTLFLLVGTLLGNLIGTTGASMLLIRPWIEMNRDHIRASHIVFFIFTVCNMGGALLPVGPPLFLGYIKGVPFWWAVQRCWAPWAVTLAAILIVFWAIDTWQFKKGYQTGAHPWVPTLQWHCLGAPNFAFMFVLLVALITAPAGWRELIMASAAAVALIITPRRIYTANEFTFKPIREVGWIFLGIFGTIIPVFDFVEQFAVHFGIRSGLQLYWATGLLSGFLDNAPTYLVFLAGVFGLHGLSIENPAQVAEFATIHDHYLIAISLGATCFGALTYIGNGPNLFIRSISEHANVKTPSFLGYVVRFALPVLIPIFALVSLLFLRVR